MTEIAGTTPPPIGHDTGRRIGYAPGAYDLFHIGHLNLLLRAKEECDHLIAGAATERMSLETKGKAPVVPLEERMAILRHIDVVDQVVVDDSRDKREVWHHTPYDILFKGNDWRGTEKGFRLEEDMAAVGVRVHYLPYTEQTSSTYLRAALDRLLI